MRNFGHVDSSALICLYNRRTGLYVPHAPSKSQACADYFYEKGGEIEKILADMENSVGPVITEILRAEAPPKWRSDDDITVLKFVVLQSKRTEFAKEQMNESSKKVLGKINELFPGEFPNLTEKEVDRTATARMLVSMSEMNYHAAVDLRCKLLRNKTGIPFITSDHPVVRYNQYFERHPSLSDSGLICRGLQMFFPLNPQYLLVLFDSDVYKVGGRNFKVTCVDVTKDDVEALNTLQVVNAGEHLYFSQDVRQAYIEALVKRANGYLKTEKARVRAGPAFVGDRRHGTIVAGCLVDIRIGLNLHCMKITPKAKERYSPSLHPRNRYRNLDLLQIFYEFSREVLAKKMKESQFEEFRKKREQERNASHSRVSR